MNWNQAYAQFLSLLLLFCRLAILAISSWQTWLSRREPTTNRRRQVHTWIWPFQQRQWTSIAHYQRTLIIVEHNSAKEWMNGGMNEWMKKLANSHSGIRYSNRSFRPPHNNISNRRRRSPFRRWTFRGLRHRPGPWAPHRTHLGEITANLNPLHITPPQL